MVICITRGEGLDKGRGAKEQGAEGDLGDLEDLGDLGERRTNYSVFCLLSPVVGLLSWVFFLLLVSILTFHIKCLRQTNTRQW